MQKELAVELPVALLCRTAPPAAARPTVLQLKLISWFGTDMWMRLRRVTVALMYTCVVPVGVQSSMMFSLAVVVPELAGNVTATATVLFARFLMWMSGASAEARLTRLVVVLPVRLDAGVL